jgi:hypothetical protein
MKIDVRTYLSFPHDVCVLVDGECNHADMHFEIEREDYQDEYGRVSEWDSHLYVCNKCGSYRDATVEDSEWQGVTVMPVRWA